MLNRTIDRQYSQLITLWKAHSILYIYSYLLPDLTVWSLNTSIATHFSSIFNYFEQYRENKHISFIIVPSRVLSYNIWANI